MQKFRQNLESIKLAYNIGVFSKEYARNKFARLYAETFGGNWGAMLLTGIKRVFPEHYA